MEHGELAFYVEDEDGRVNRTVAGPRCGCDTRRTRARSATSLVTEARAFVIFSPGAPRWSGFAARQALSLGPVRPAWTRSSRCLGLGIEMTHAVEGIA